MQLYLRFLGRNSFLCLGGGKLVLEFYIREPALQHFLHFKNDIHILLSEKKRKKRRREREREREMWVKLSGMNVSNLPKILTTSSFENLISPSISHRKYATLNSECTLTLTQQSLYSMCVCVCVCECVCGDCLKNISHMFWAHTWPV